MKVGIALPVTVSGVTIDRILEWAKKADQGPFSSVGGIDWLAYQSYEMMTTLAAVAAVTQRVRLMTTVIVAPLRNTVLLAKQAATVDALSGGRLTLGLGVGEIEEDFKASRVSPKGRGRRFEEQLALMKKVGSGGELEEGVGPIGPTPRQQTGPELLIGAHTPVALKRCGRWADGCIIGIDTPANLRQQYDIVEESWREADRAGKPRLVGVFYFALTADATDRAASSLRRYYSFMPSARADHFVSTVFNTPESIKGALRDYSEIGMDEVIFYPCAHDIEEADRLAELI